MGRKNSRCASLAGRAENGGIYEIRIKGRLDERWLDWFDGMTLRYEQDQEAGEEVTIINATLGDQPALHGFLDKIRDLNLTLLSVKREPWAPADDGRGSKDAEHGD